MTHWQINGWLKTHWTIHRVRVQHMFNWWGKYSGFWMSLVEYALNYTRLRKAERKIRFLFLEAGSGELNHFFRKESISHLCWLQVTSHWTCSQKPCTRGWIDLDSDMPWSDSCGEKICKLYIATWCAKHQKFDSMWPFLQELFLETQKWII